MPVDPVTTLIAVGTCLKIIDSLTGQWDRFFKKRTEQDPEQPHRVTTEQAQPDTIIVRDHGRPVDTITANDIAKLDANSRRLIEALEKSMQRQFDLWQRVYPTRDQSPDQIVNAQIDQRLEDIVGKMCADLKSLFGYLNRIGKQLDDHYSHVRYLCDEVEKQKANG